MTTLSASRSSAKSTTVRPFSCSFVSITIEISDVRYAVDAIPAGEFGTSAFRLTKKSGDRAVYDLVRTHAGLVECCCPSYETTHRNTPDLCKHGRALVELGLMAGPTPVIATVEPTPPPKRKTTLIDKLNADKAASLRFKAENGVIDPPAPAKCSECHNPSVIEHGSMPYCRSCYGHMLDTPPCCPPDEATACMACVATTAVLDLATASPDGSSKGLHSIKTLPTTPVLDPATAILNRGVELAKALAAAPDVVIRHENTDLEPAGDDGANLTPLGRVEPIELPDDETDVQEQVEQPDTEPTEDERAEVAESFTAMDVRDYLDRSEALPLPEAIDHIGNAFRAWGTAFGSMLAHVLGELAQKAFMTGATTPNELLTGIETLDREARAQWERIGFQAGKAEARKPLADIDDPAVRRGKPQPLNACGSQPYFRHGL